MRGIKKAYIFCVFGAFVVFITSATNLHSYISPSIITITNLGPPDSTKLKYPLPKEDPNPFLDAEKQTDGIKLENSPELSYSVTYNETTGEYEIQKKLGDLPLGPVYSMSPQEFFKFSGKERRKDYWQNKASEARKDTINSSLSSLNLAKSEKEGFFAENEVDIKTQGAAEITFGFKYNNNQNPRFSKDQQRSFLFDFDNKIQMSVTGKIGDKVGLTVKYDTESQFEFDKEIKLKYEGDEDEIIKKIDFGDVSFPIKSSLITGSQSLFGVQSELQFGKLYINTVFSRQQGEFSSINVQGGAQTENFEIRADNYDKNKHFFLGHYFRDSYEKAFSNVPEITSGITIRKVEIWVTQTSTGKEDSRNILALSDLGDVYTFGPSGKTYELPKNINLYTKIKNIQGIRDINNVSNLLNNEYNQGRDYEKIEQAVLLKPNEYDINTELGYISLRTAINPSKILAIAYEYEYKGEVYQVGEFSTDGVDHPDVLIVKLLKSSQTNPTHSNWDLMMKNAYSIGGYGISPKDFVVDVLYEDDKTGTPIPYIPEGDIKGKNLLSVMNLDTISTDNQPYADGFYDAIEGYTINSKRGILFFPVLEPFGNHLEKKINNSSISQRYVYHQLYDSTQSAARQVSEKNKFLLKGSYKSSVQSNISLNATQVQEGSVKVTAGGRTLVEGVDYTVDYMGGTVRIINEGLLSSGSNIQVAFESNPLFSMRSKTLVGARLDYKFSKNFNIGTTFMRLTENPVTTKVGFDDFPIVNNIWGTDISYSSPAPILTRFVDKYIPFVQTKEASNIAFSAEFAQLIPGKSDAFNNAVILDNFENTEGRIYLREPSAWRIASTPQGQKNFFPEGNLVNSLAYSYNKAHISWYNINTSLYDKSSSVPVEIQHRNYSRPVYQTNLFPNRDVKSYENMPLTILNIAYYPTQKGQYNFDTKGLPGISSGILADGTLKNPETRWGGIMQSLSTTDFEETNIEYVEFWLMDPFADDSLDTHTGGDLYLNLGRVSEDVIRDGRKAAENGLLPDKSRYDETIWGRVPNYSIVETGFSNDVAREIQDVGLDGISNLEEQSFYATYLAEIKGIVTPEVYEKMYIDPANDNYQSYLDNRGKEIDIVWRYKYYSGTENNTPFESTQGVSTYKPDVEDLNSDNTLQESEAYYQYKLSLRKQDLQVGKNFIVDEIIEEYKPTGYAATQTKWYQFKIPINSDKKERIGDISDFRDIPNMRMYLKGFSDSVVLRVAEFALVYSNWRRYNKPLYEAGEYDIFNDSEFDISSLNIEENSSRKPVNYILPPGVSRENDPTNGSRLLNEGAISLTVQDLDDGNSKAIYKQFNKDFRQFGNLKMFIHAEAPLTNNDVKDNDMYAFIRIGSDFTENFYEYEIPLKLTIENYYTNTTEDQNKVWPEENIIEFDFDILKNLKLERDAIIQNNTIANLETYHLYSIPLDNKRISIKGKPNLGNVRTIMIGIRNKKKNIHNQSDDGQKKSITVWFNELQLSDIEDQSGWAAIVSTRMNFADFATVSLSGKTSKPGFGSIDQKIFERSKEELYQYDVASNISLHKFFPSAWNISLPFYVDFSEIYITPQYDPTNPDILLKESLKNIANQQSRDSVLRLAQDFSQRFSYNITNIRIGKESKKPMPWSISNFSTSFAYNQYLAHDIRFAKDYNYEYKAAFDYNYNIRPKNIQPLKSSKIKFLKEFNFYLLPTTIAINNNWDRYYSEQQRRNLSTFGNLPITANKSFTWDRIYNVNFPLSKNLKLSYNAINNARINEPFGVINKNDIDKWQEYKNEVFSNISNFGENLTFSQKWEASYTLPFNLFKLTDWVTSTYKYSGTYDWIKGAELRNNDDFGNIIKNSNAHSINGNFNFTRLYNKSKYLTSVQKRIKQNNSNTTGKTNNQPKKETVKFDKNNVALEMNKPTTIKHKLNTEDVRLTVMDENGKIVQGATKVISKNSVEFTANADVAKAKIIVTGKKDIIETGLTRFFDNTANTLMMIKSISVDYTVTEGTFIPGYKYETQYFGLHSPFNQLSIRPDVPYIFGIVPNTLDDRLNTSSWIVNNDLITEKYMYNTTDNWKIQSTIEPFTNMRITLNSNRSFSKNNSRYLIGDSELNKLNAQTTGSFSISYNTVSTTFDADKAYEDFKKNRITIANRIAQNKFGTNYEINPDNSFPSLIKETSQDVLIPAFISAYSGESASSIRLDNHFIPIFSSVESFLKTLNWRLTYNGLSKLPLFKNVFKSININHAYTSKLDIASFTNFTNENSFNSDFFIDRVDGELYLASKYDASTIAISERFNPIIGIDAKLDNNLTAKIELRSNRNVSLSFKNTEISETSGLEYVFGAGYVFEKLKISVKTGQGKKTYQNDLTVRIDISIRDNQTIRRNIIEDITRKISGTRVVSLKSYAEYMISERFTARIYLDRNMNKPLTNGYKTSSLNGGINLRFTLM